MNQLDQLAVDTSIAIRLLEQQVEDLCADNPNWITASEAAKLLNITNARINKMCMDEVVRSAAGKRRCYVYKPDILARLSYIAKNGKPVRGQSKIR